VNITGRKVATTTIVSDALWSGVKVSPALLSCTRRGNCLVLGSNGETVIIETQFSTPLSSAIAAPFSREKIQGCSWDETSERFLMITTHLVKGIGWKLSLWESKGERKINWQPVFVSRDVPSVNAYTMSAFNSWNLLEETRLYCSQPVNYPAQSVGQMVCVNVDSEKITTTKSSLPTAFQSWSLDSSRLVVTGDEPINSKVGLTT
jgi:hypothetical protein